LAEEALEAKEAQGETNLGSIIGEARAQTMELNDIPLSELIALSEHNELKSYMIWGSTDGRVVIWKLRFKDDREEVCFLAPALAVHFTKSTESAAVRHRWPASSDWPDEPPEVTEEDRDLSKNRLGTQIACRIESFTDGLVVAFHGPSNYGVVTKLSPALAVQIAELHRDLIDNGTLRDIVSETPQTKTRQ
jgi:hypothetical protein